MCHVQQLSICHVQQLSSTGLTGLIVWPGKEQVGLVIRSSVSEVSASYWRNAAAFQTYALGVLKIIAFLGGEADQ